jgi:glycosyltransferase involved in cell wall biosynthesis
LREILNENNSVLVRPDDALALADGIKLVLSNGALAVRISKKAFEDVKRYSWQERAQKIIAFMGPH